MKFTETHRYLMLTRICGRHLHVSCAYVRQIEDASWWQRLLGGRACITVADQATSRCVREPLAEIMTWLKSGTVRYTEDPPCR